PPVPLPEGFQGPPAPPMTAGKNGYETPLLPGQSFDRLPDAFAAMDALYAELQVSVGLEDATTPPESPLQRALRERIEANGGTVPEPPAPGSLPRIDAVGTTPSGDRAPGLYTSPFVPGRFNTKADVVRAYLEVEGSSALFSD
ncbi:MAG: hypothetical protein R3F62_24585, partial [Planctomycetota bacterium]